ncbi:ZCRB1 [Bugula neritina]|uniref:ZCRB1 n=1 Tax=Bugula neritina TaxID=10212 RepID=A0A7J7KKP5_BUGNE|nr:ZCRB1 [Bugula neritina]
MNININTESPAQLKDKPRNSLAPIFDKYGKVVKVTVVKDRKLRRSKGVAFILYLRPDEAWAAVKAVNQTTMFGRSISCSIAKDNGRAPEFIKRKEYKDKSQCYECGEEGHLSYKCPKNIRGARTSS